MPRVAGPQFETCHGPPSFWVRNGTIRRKVGRSIETSCRAAEGATGPLATGSHGQGSGAASASAPVGTPTETKPSKPALASRNRRRPTEIGADVRPFRDVPAMATEYTATVPLSDC